jgi:hypothetical protein
VIAEDPDVPAQSDRLSALARDGSVLTGFAGLISLAMAAEP